MAKYIRVVNDFFQLNIKSDININIRQTNNVNNFQKIKRHKFTSHINEPVSLITYMKLYRKALTSVLCKNISFQD